MAQAQKKPVESVPVRDMEERIRARATEIVEAAYSPVERDLLLWRAMCGADHPHRLPARGVILWIAKVQDRAHAMLKAHREGRTVDLGTGAITDPYGAPRGSWPAQPDFRP